MHSNRIPLEWMGCQVLRRSLPGPARSRSQHKVDAEGTAQVLIVLVWQHAVIEPSGKQEQQARLGSHIDPGSRPGGLGQVSLGQRSAVTDSHPRDQLVDLTLGPKAKGSAATAAITSEVIDRTEMGIGVVMTAHHLSRFAQHRPAALDVQTDLVKIKTEGYEVSLGVINELPNQRHEGPMVVQLPNAIEVASPGTARIRIAACIATQSVERLELEGQIKRFGPQLDLPERHWKQRLDHQRTRCRAGQKHG